MLFCGLGHVYAKRRVTGAILALAFITLFGAMIFVANANSFAGIWWALITLIVCDFVGGQIAVRAHNRGRPPRDRRAD